MAQAVTVQHHSFEARDRTPPFDARRDRKAYQFGHPLGGSGLGLVADHFDVVPVRTNGESRKVVRVVVRAQARRTIVFAARLESCAMESLNLLAILGRERQVKTRWLLLGLEQTSKRAMRDCRPAWVMSRTVQDRPFQARPGNHESKRHSVFVPAPVRPLHQDGQQDGSPATWRAQP